jgi:galactose mutarotase-like enzyme
VTTETKSLAVALRSERASAIVDPASGGRLLSLVIDGHEVIATVPQELVDELLPGDAGARRDWYRGSFPLAPWAGLLPDGAFTFDGARYEVERDESGAAQHGVVADVAWTVDSSSDEAVALSTPFGPGLPGRWPFGGRATQSFVLDKSVLRMRLEVHSTSEPMPAIAGYHPWFRRELDGGAAASVGFSPRRRLTPRPTADLGERPWDDLFIELEGSPTIAWEGGPSLTLESAAPVWVYYERMPIGFCIEPWTGANGGLDTAWASVVTPGTPLILDFSIHF